MDKPHESCYEKIMRIELERRNLDFVQEHSVRSGFVIDFAFPDKMLGIECDGERYHKIGNRRDTFRDWMLKRAGWKIMRFRGKEIESNIKNCVNKIESCLW